MRSPEGARGTGGCPGCLVFLLFQPAQQHTQAVVADRLEWADGSPHHVAVDPSGLLGSGPCDRQKFRQPLVVRFSVLRALGIVRDGRHFAVRRGADRRHDRGFGRCWGRRRRPVVRRSNSRSVRVAGNLVRTLGACGRVSGGFVRTRSVVLPYLMVLQVDGDRTRLFGCGRTGRKASLSFDKRS